AINRQADSFKGAMKSIQYPYTIHKAKLSNGTEIAYVDEGKGTRTILFIHGLAMYSLCWHKNIEELKYDFRCIAIDLPGNGMSSNGNYPYGIRFFADTVYELIQILDLKNLCIAGHSMGGQIAMRLLINYPGTANKVVLCAPAGFETFNHFQRSVYKSTVQFADFFSTDENSLRHVVHSSFFNYVETADQMTEQLIALMKTQPSAAY